MRKAFFGLALPTIAAVIALAGCGGGSGYGGGSNNSSSEGGTAASPTTSSGRYGAEGSGGYSSSSPSSGAGTVSTGSAAGVGKVLVDSNGMTLYYFEKDKRGGEASACNGTCAGGWPPLTTSGAAKAMSGAQSSQLGTIKRSDGTTQVTYNGWPLYTYVGDSQPGEANGTDLKAFGGSWYPLHSNGKRAGS